MKIPMVVAFNLMVLAGLVAGVTMTPSVVAAAADTEDVVYLTDGRVLHGRVLSQSGTEIEFEWLDKRGTTESKIKLTLDTTKIQRIERDVAKTAPAAPASPASPGAPAAPASPAASTPAATAPAATSPASGTSASAGGQLPKIYIVPMRGQMGTDVHPDVYKQVAADIRANNPDLIIIKMNCQDIENRLHNRKEKEDAGFTGSEHLDHYRDLVNLFKDDLRQYRQVMWIEDSVGISSVIALAWPELYMKPEARLGGLARAAANFEAVKQDANMYGKYREAYMAWLKGFVEYGKRDLVVVDAMVRPEFTLSASFKGRTVHWAANTEGDYVVDQDKERTANFTARAAENVLLSDGTVEETDDLAFMLGFEEYQLVDSKAEELVKKYIDDWRRAFKKCEDDLEDFDKFTGYAGGNDTAKWLGKAKAALVDIQAAMNRYGAVTIRMGTDYHLNKLAIEARIEQINEQLARLKNTRSKGSGGGSGGSGSGGGAGPGGG